MIRADILTTPTDKLTPEQFDDVLRVVNAVADEYNTSGVDTIDLAVWELRALKRNLTRAEELFEELFDRALRGYDEKPFKELLIAVRKHAGERDDDLYND